MKRKNYEKLKVSDYELTEDQLIIRNNQRFGKFSLTAIDLDKVSDDDLEALELLEKGTHYVNMIVAVENKQMQYMYLEANPVKINKKEPALSKYVKKVRKPIEYINYELFGIYSQLDGITTVIGMSGGGKTHTAVNMLPTFSRVFTKIAYLNYELTEADIELRIEQLTVSNKVKEDILNKLYIHDEIMTELRLDRILEALDVQEDDKIAFIIDNVGSVIGQEDDIYRKQNEFIKDLDVLCKRKGWHALALTQVVKDNNFKMFDKDGEFALHITNSIMSGSIMLGNLSRTVMLVGHNGHTFKRKVLKRLYGIWNRRGGKNEDTITI